MNGEVDSTSEKPMYLTRHSNLALLIVLPVSMALTACAGMPAANTPNAPAPGPCNSR